MRVSQRGDEDGLGVAWVHADPGYVARRAKTEVTPRFSSVRRPIHAISVGDAVADARFAHADVYDVRIGGRNCDCTHRRPLEEPVADVSPVQSSVRALPNAATTGAEIEDVPMVVVARDGYCPPTSVRTDRSPLEAIQRDHCRWLIRSRGR